MRDNDDFLIRCKHSKWQIIDANDNKDYVCQHECETLEHYCYADERCKYYVPNAKEGVDNG